MKLYIFTTHLIKFNKISFFHIFDTFYLFIFLLYLSPSSQNLLYLLKSRISSVNSMLLLKIVFRIPILTSSVIAKTRGLGSVHLHIPTPLVHILSELSTKSGKVKKFSHSLHINQQTTK